MSFTNRIFILSLVPTMLASLAFGATTWKIEKVDRAAPGNRVVQLSIAKNGDKHLVYTGCSDGPCVQSELFYSVLSGDYDWEKTPVDSKGNDTGWFPSIAFDANSVAHIFYADHSTESLRYSTNKDSKWISQDLGSGRGGWWTSSAAANGKVYFAHTKLPKEGWENAALEVGTLQNGNWNFEVVDGARNAGWFTSMAVLPNGNPVVSYNSVFSQPVGSVKIAIKEANKWNIVDVDGNSIKHHVAVDASGSIHLVYQKSVAPPTDKAPNGFHDLMYATNTGGSWKRAKLQVAGTEGVTDTGNFPRINTDARGGLHVVYIMNGEQLVYATRSNANAAWEFSVVDEMGGAIYPWVEIESNGKVNIAYERGGSIYLATCTNCSK